MFIKPLWWCSVQYFHTQHFFNQITVNRKYSWHDYKQQESDAPLALTKPNFHEWSEPVEQFEPLSSHSEGWKEKIWNQRYQRNVFLKCNRSLRQKVTVYEKTWLAFRRVTWPTLTGNILQCAIQAQFFREKASTLVKAPGEATETEWQFCNKSQLSRGHSDRHFVNWIESTALVINAAHASVSLRTGRWLNNRVARAGQRQPASITI